VTHQVVLYFLDWDNSGRAEMVTLLNANTMAPLDTSRNVSNFQNGQYLKHSRARSHSFRGDGGPQWAGQRVVPGASGAITDGDRVDSRQQ